VHLAARLVPGGFTLLDTQFVTDHLRQFGTIEVDRDEFHRMLEAALKLKADFSRLERDVDPARVLEILDRARAHTPAR
jgi:leucyl/phenylalanyl-tRNA--protein transferase